MPELDIESIYVNLLEGILTHRYLYYVLAKPIIDDQEYDKLEKILYKIEEQYPELISAYSPSKVPGSDLAKNYPPHIRKELE